MRRLLTVLLLACAAVGGWIAPAQAHNVLVSSDPGDGTTLTAAPRRLTLVFDQPVRQGYAQIGLTGPAGTIPARKAAVAKERVTVSLAELPGRSGAYVIGYRILSADGHPVSGQVRFTLNLPAGSTTAQPGSPPGADAAQGGLSAQAAEAAANGGAGMAVLWIGGALVLLAVGTVIALRRGPASGTGGDRRG
ncbi:copper resistance CopC family protein [Nonomuraea typhae]|uniref:copper resistance CopC family protein n=1 Tax=Nonomuraea typhae TaxID=2603600 RepID=UPI0012FB0348|nr:copper resistance CopC family protein [Nonomuraea typhae]